MGRKHNEQVIASLQEQLQLCFLQQAQLLQNPDKAKIAPAIAQVGAHQQQLLQQLHIHKNYVMQANSLQSIFTAQNGDARE